MNLEAGEKKSSERTGETGAIVVEWDPSSLLN